MSLAIGILERELNDIKNDLAWAKENNDNEIAEDRLSDIADINHAIKILNEAIGSEVHSCYGCKWIDKFTNKCTFCSRKAKSIDYYEQE